MHPNTRDGLTWDESGLDSVPVWAREPKMDAIVNVCRQRLQVKGSETCEVSFYAEGGFNKLYLVQTSDRQFLMRVTLPVYPHNKTLGEVTTLRFLRRATDVPVPEVIAFDDSANNEIGFEWILMERMPGVPAYQRWRTLSAFQKAVLVQRTAELQAQIFRHTFSGIGTLRPSNGEHYQKERPDEMVSSIFFWGNHFGYDLARGPFRSTYEWLSSCLAAMLKDHTVAKEEAEDEEDEEDAASALALTHRLIKLLPKIFPALQSPPERSVLLHEDLSLNNILVNEQGNITAVIDWECVSAMPLWMATMMPKFLDGSTREKEPKRQNYADESDEETELPEYDKSGELDNEGKNELYWIHLMEYEQTQLRRVYNNSMRQLRPDWDAEVEDSALMEDFVGAVFRCGNGFHLERIGRWVDAVEKGEFPRLIDILKAGLSV